MKKSSKDKARTAEQIFSDMDFDPLEESIRLIKTSTNIDQAKKLRSAVSMIPYKHPRLQATTIDANVDTKTNIKISFE